MLMSHGANLQDLPLKIIHELLPEGALRKSLLYVTFSEAELLS
jgi:hypothetical protein